MRKYIALQSSQILYTFVLHAEIIPTTFGPKMVAISVIVPCFAHQYSKRYVMDISVLQSQLDTSIYTHPNLKPNLQP
jgi:hypothetical protein